MVIMGDEASLVPQRKDSTHLHRRQKEIRVQSLGWGRSPEGGNGNPLQCSCLESSMDRGDGQATVHGGHKESDTTE